MITFQGDLHDDILRRIETRIVAVAQRRFDLAAVESRRRVILAVGHPETHRRRRNAVIGVERAARSRAVQHELLASAVRIGEIHVLSLHRKFAVPVGSQLLGLADIGLLSLQPDSVSARRLDEIEFRQTARQRDGLHVAARIAHRQFILESNGPRLALRSIFQQRRLVGVDQQRTLADISVEVGIIGIERDFITVRRSLDFGIAQQLPFQQCIAAADRHFVDRFLLFVGLGHQHRKPQAEVGLLHRHDILVHGTGVDVKPRLYGLQFLVGVVFLHTSAKNQRHSHGRYK